MSEIYYSARPELEELVPPRVSVVYDIGCGDGSVGAGFKRTRPDLAVYGVEPVQDAAQQARAVLDGVLVGGAEDSPPSDWPAPDLVLFADVLEHLNDPWSCLAAWAERVPAGTRLLISLPNVLHGTVIGPLFSRGRWDYADSGILDRTHVRFFTRDTALELVGGAGFVVDRLHRNVRPTRSRPWEAIRWVAERLDRRGWPEGGLPSSGFRLHDIFTLQFYIEAHRP